MSKALEATCVGGVVKVGNVVVPGAVILGEGVAQSSGLLFIEEDRATYVPRTSPDLKSTIDQLIATLDQTMLALTQIGNSLSTIGAVVGPAWVPPPNIPADVAVITAKVVQLTLVKVQLNVLKGSLI